MTLVLVSGINGFVAVKVLVSLLKHGYDIVGTVRSESKTAFLRNKFKDAVDSGKLKFAIVADITAAGAFDEVLKQYQFDFVLHTSSPFHFNVKDVEKELLDPAIKGTKSILESIEKVAPSVKHVVITSSFAAVGNFRTGAAPGYVYTEDDWCPAEWDEAIASPYVGYLASKTWAERAAWDFVKDRKPRFTLTTLLPSMVFGPPEQEVDSMAKLNQSSSDIYNLFNGTAGPVFGIWAWTDSRDLAEAHVLAIEKPEAKGQRYLIINGKHSPQYFANYIWKHYPDRAAEKSVTKPTDKLYPDGGVYDVDNSKSIRDLGITYRGLDTMMRDTLKRFEELEAEGK
ncbi:methylglyoxal reductase (NADPH-dependent) gre2 [Tulasnella sp. 417]|nr:methylglyoxal reductase (NADPH-dependent) gre2 [Tulasnella sp. 417]